MKLGQRMKRYENATKLYLTPKVPAILRIDGKAFHTYTKHFKKPFDVNIMTAMRTAAYQLAKQIQGFRLAYIQSDEASFLFDDLENLESQGWFNYRIDKINSIAASIFTAEFNNIISNNKMLAYFDARCFNIPKEDIINYFLWRALDWKRNSIQMYARKFFSHKELHKKKQEDIHEMLHSIGKNWCEDLVAIEKNGTYIYKQSNELVFRYDVLPKYDDILRVVKLYNVIPYI